MRKRISLLIAALMLALTMSFGSVAAFAAQDLPPGCTKDQGTVTCTTTTTSKKNDKFSETTTTTTQGNTSNFSPEPQGTGTESGCSDSNPGNSCPKGQF